MTIIVEGPYDLKRQNPAATPIGIVVVKDYKGRDDFGFLSRAVDLSFVEVANYISIDQGNNQRRVIHADIDQLIVRIEERAGTNPFEEHSLRSFLDNVLHNPEYSKARGFQTDPSADVYRDLSEMSPACRESLQRRIMGNRKFVDFAARGWK